MILLNNIRITRVKRKQQEKFSNLNRDKWKWRQEIKINNKIVTKYNNLLEGKTPYLRCLEEVSVHQSTYLHNVLTKTPPTLLNKQAQAQPRHHILRVAAIHQSMPRRSMSLFWKISTLHSSSDLEGDWGSKALIIMALATVSVPTLILFRQSNPRTTTWNNTCYEILLCHVNMNLVFS